LFTNVNSLALSPDATCLAALVQPRPLPGGGGFFEPVARIELRDMAGDRRPRELTVRVKPGAPGPAKFRALTFSADGKTLVAGGADPFVRGWDVATGQERWRVTLGPEPPTALALSADGKLLAAACDRAVLLFDVRTAKELPRAFGPRDHVQAVALTPDARALVTRSGNRVLLWDAATGRPRGRLEGQEGELLALHLAGDRPTIFTNGPSEIVRAWDPATGKELRRLPVGPAKGWPPLQAVSPDGKVLVLATDAAGMVLADAVTGKTLRTLAMNPTMVRGAAFTPDGRTLVFWGVDQKANVWDVATGKERCRIPCQDTPLGAGQHFGYVAALAPDNKRIAFGTLNHLLTVRDLASGKMLRQVEDLPEGVGVLTFAPDGRTIAWAGTGSTIHLLEVATGQERHRLQGHQGSISSLAFSADGSRLVSGGADTTALVWDLTGGRGVQGPLGPGELDECWRDLAGDAAPAYRAVRRMAAAPTEAVLYLRGRLPSVVADARHLARLIGDLDSERFAVRDAAQKELEKLGEAALPACRKALADNPPIETRRRLEGLLKRWAREEQVPSPEWRRVLRALEAVERTGTPAARRVLSELAAGPAEWRMTREAQEALARLKARPPSTP
jgi:WD40 repeat protein